LASLYIIPYTKICATNIVHKYAKINLSKVRQEVKNSRQVNSNDVNLIIEAVSKSSDKFSKKLNVI
jgi:septum formation topological specificity factor MinE